MEGRDTKRAKVLHQALDAPGPRRALFVGLFFLLVLPLIAAGVVGYYSSSRSLTEGALSQRSALAYLAANVLEEKFGRMSDLAVSFATRVAFRQRIEAGDWQGAAGILRSVPVDFPYIERVFLADPGGTLMADVPSLGQTVGQNFAFRDWYMGTVATWEPYVSKIYARTAEPRYNLVAVTAPISAEDGEHLGILVMQVRLESFLDWTGAIDVGPEGYAFFVDQDGNLAGHPRYPAQGEIVNFSGSAAVRSGLLGERAAMIADEYETGEEEVVAYAPVAGYGWAAVVAQPSSEVFASRRAEILFLGIVFSVLVPLSMLIAYVVLRMLAALNRYRQKERIFIESIGDGIVAIDRYWTITSMNRAATKISGWPRDEAVGKPLREVLRFVREHDRKENLGFIEHAMVTGEVATMENGTVLIRKDGTEIPVGDSASPLLDERGRVVGTIIIFRDVTQEREAERSRSDLAYASHQLRNPIVQASWAMEAALETEDLAEAKENVRTALHTFQSLKKSIEELVEVAAVEKGQVVRKLGDVKLLDLIEKALADAKSLAMMRDVALEVAPISAIAEITTDARFLTKAIAEVAGNAVVYSRKGSEVRVEAVIENGALIVTVEDQGIGIPAGEQTIVFHKFFRGTNVDVSQSVGAGLGLFLAHEYVRMLGGTIWFESQEGRGSTFYIRIPLK